MPANRQPFYVISAFMDKNVITGSCCNDICKEKATPSYYHPIFPTFALKIEFLAIFHRLCLLMGYSLIPPPLLLTTLLSLGAVAMISAERKLLQAVTTPFSHHLIKNWIFSHFWPFLLAHWGGGVAVATSPGPNDPWLWNVTLYIIWTQIVAVIKAPPM